MTYPIFNLYPKWEEGLIQELVRYDDEYHSSDNEFFQTYFFGQTFVDSEGKLYRLDSVKDYTATKLWVFKSQRKRLHFKSLEESFSFEELKSELLKRSETLSLETVKQDFIELVNSVDSIQELLRKM